MADTCRTSLIRHADREMLDEGRIEERNPPGKIETIRARDARHAMMDMDDAIAIEMRDILA
jgi:hypothetical protein